MLFTFIVDLKLRPGPVRSEKKYFLHIQNTSISIPGLLGRYLNAVIRFTRVVDSVRNNFQSIRFMTVRFLTRFTALKWCKTVVNNIFFRNRTVHGTMLYDKLPDMTFYEIITRRIAWFYQRPYKIIFDSRLGLKPNDRNEMYTWKNKTKIDYSRVMKYFFANILSDSRTF